MADEQNPNSGSHIRPEPFNPKDTFLRPGETKDEFKARMNTVNAVGMTEEQQRRLNRILTGFETQEEMDALKPSPQMSAWLSNPEAFGKMPVVRTDLRNAAIQVIEMVLAKNADYGDAWQTLGSVGATARFVDKMFRIEHLANGAEALVVDEKLGDTVADLVGYGLLIMLYLKFHGGSSEQTKP